MEKKKADSLKSITKGKCIQRPCRHGRRALEDVVVRGPEQVAARETREAGPPAPARSTVVTHDLPALLT